MKLNLPPRSPRADTSNLARGEFFTATSLREPVSMLKGGLYQSAEEAAHRKLALITRLNDRQRTAKAALLARRGIMTAAAPPT